MRSKLQAVLVAMALSGCGVDVADIDEGGDDSALDESSLGSFPGLTEGSRDAIGVLKLASEGSKLQLTQGAGVVARTVKSILATRSGPDGLEGTADDRRFSTLAQLFAVKYVGKGSVQSLLTYARAHGYVPPQDDPMPTCEGVPASGEVLFTGGSQTSFTRTCDGAGVCSPWRKNGYAQSVRQDNGHRSLLLTSSGDLYVQAQVGLWFTSQSGGTYNCKYQDYGTGKLNPVTGIGTGQLRDGYRCDISGGSGGPSSQNEYRPVALQLGATCLAISDTTGSSQGTQRKRVTILYR